jgi:phenylpyruvate tautomerase PptA (4-oxalocrotonate tautomerase family)
MSDQQAQYEERLLANVRAMTNKDRIWVMAITDRLANQLQKDPDQVVVAFHYPPPLPPRK